ncbi:MAG: four helix bundle protein [Myxococcota bacterium]
MSKNIVKDKSFRFAVRIVNNCAYLKDQKKEFVLSKQLLRSGTAVGALVREAQNAESNADFIHKMSIAQKECDETLYWLELLQTTNFLDPQLHQHLHEEATALLKIIRSIIINTKNKTR